MGEKSSRITHAIEETRAPLGWNLQELEHRVKRLSDWRLRFEQRPFSLMVSLWRRRPAGGGRKRSLSSAFPFAPGGERVSPGRSFPASAGNLTNFKASAGAENPVRPPASEGLKPANAGARAKFVLILKVLFEN
jgi:hypothetical protein